MGGQGTSVRSDDGPASLFLFAREGGEWVLPAKSGLAKTATRFMAGINRLTDAMAFISGVLLFTLGPMITIAVIMRYYFKVSVAWSTEIEEYMLYLAVLLAAPWIMRKDAHVRVDVLLNKAKDSTKRVLQLIGNTVGLLICSGLFCFGLLATYENFIRGTKIIKVMPIPKYLPLLIVPIMGFVLFFIFLFNIWEWWNSIPLKREQQEEKDLVDQSENPRIHETGL
jgi:TRAP-type C4-dicarboxylate transport system permease small subunit